MADDSDKTKVTTIRVHGPTSDRIYALKTREMKMEDVVILLLDFYEENHEFIRTVKT